MYRLRRSRRVVSSLGHHSDWFESRKGLTIFGRNEFVFSCMIKHQATATKNVRKACFLIRISNIETTSLLVYIFLKFIVTIGDAPHGAQFCSMGSTSRCIVS